MKKGRFLILFSSSQVNIINNIDLMDDRDIITINQRYYLYPLKAVINMLRLSRSCLSI